MDVVARARRKLGRRASVPRDPSQNKPLQQPEPQWPDACFLLAAPVLPHWFNLDSASWIEFETDAWVAARAFVLFRATGQGHMLFPLH